MPSFLASSPSLLVLGLTPPKIPPFLTSPTNSSRILISTLISISSPSPLLRVSPVPRASREEQESRVQELRVPGSWLVPARAAQESEWLRESLHKWLDDEYCPEPANVDISNLAARSYYESLTAKQSDLGEILLKMVGDLETLSYRESFHGPFSAANAAVRLITQRMESSHE